MMKIVSFKVFIFAVLPHSPIITFSGLHAILTHFFRRNEWTVADMIRHDFPSYLQQRPYINKIK